MNIVKGSQHIFKATTLFSKVNTKKKKNSLESEFNCKILKAFQQLRCFVVVVAVAVAFNIFVI